MNAGGGRGVNIQLTVSPEPHFSLTEGSTISLRFFWFEIREVKAELNQTKGKVNTILLAHITGSFQELGSANRWAETPQSLWALHPSSPGRLPKCSLALQKLLHKCQQDVFWTYLS